MLGQVRQKITLIFFEQGTEIAGGSHYRFSFKNSNVNVIIFQALSYNGIIGNKTATIICPDSRLDPIMFE